MDHWTETYSNGFYLGYLAQWPDMTLTACAAHTDTIMGYVLGKAEGREPRKKREEITLHGHVTAVTVAPEYRRLGVAQMLMDFFEQVSEQVYQGFFVDLFVRPSNEKAIHMYEKRGYSVYRRVHRYYRGAGTQPTEDGYGRSMKRADSRRYAQIPASRRGSADRAQQRPKCRGPATVRFHPHLHATERHCLIRMCTKAFE